MSSRDPFPHTNKLLGAYLLSRPSLIESAAAIVGCRQRAEDLVQDAYLRFHDNGVDHGVRQPVAYLFQIVRNLAVDHSRRQRLESRHVASDAHAAADAANQHDPERIALNRESLDIVASALRELPSACRLAFEMHRLRGLTHKQIAAQLGISSSLVDKHIRRALTHCRDRMTQPCG